MIHNMIQPMSDWETFFNEGEQYFQVATKGLNKKNIFTNDLLYNIIALSIEKFLMSFFLYNRKMPNDHTLRGLMEETAAITPVSKDLISKISYMDGFQEICSIDQYERKMPYDVDIEKMLNIGNDVQQFIRSKVYSGNMSHEST